MRLSLCDIMCYTTSDKSVDDLDIIDFAKELREFIDKGNMSIQIDIHTNDKCRGCDKCTPDTSNPKAEILKKLAQEYGAEYIYDVADHADVLMKDPKVFEEIFRVFITNYKKNPDIGENKSFSLREYIEMFGNENKEAVRKSSESSCWDKFHDTKGYRFT